MCAQFMKLLWIIGQWFIIEHDGLHNHTSVWNVWLRNKQHNKYHRHEYPRHDIPDIVVEVAHNVRILVRTIGPSDAVIPHGNRHARLGPPSPQGRHRVLR